MKKRRLPIGGIQTFNELRRGYDVYVDKTQHIYNMASRYKAVFLSRPRRFGKSLLCSTIESLFRNEREYFDGLAISQTDWEWKEYPVIYLDLSAINYNVENGTDVLKAKLNNQLENCARKYGITVNFTEYVSINFERLINELFEKNGSVVVIVDEYDYPLLDTISNPTLNKNLREELKGFYGVLKGSSKYLRFVFITGITKFAQITLFSGMNQPIDISMMTDYCDICGITQRELEENFAPEIDGFAEKHGGREKYLSELKDYYNGYCFTRENTSVYNPYGILNHFDNDSEFAPYWSLSGAPSFLLKYLEMKGVNVLEIENARMEANKFADYKDNNISIFPLLYQAGYLTISDYESRTGAYKLNYPNIDVRKTFAEFLAQNYSESQTILAKSISIDFVDALLEGSVERFIELLKWYLHTVDYSLSSKITESYVEFAISNIINMLGLVCINEAHTANGSMDSVVFTRERIYIFEFKVDKPVEVALWQMKRKDYALLYERDGREIVKIGVVFSRESRNIVEWKIG